MPRSNALPDVWIIDDNHADHELMKIAFKNIGVECNLHAFFSSEEALEVMHQGKTPSLVLLDLNMPGQGGLHFLKERQRASYSHIPVVILSSSSNPDDITQTYSLGANSYLVKPDNYNELLDFAKCVSTYWFKLAFLPINHH